MQELRVEVDAFFTDLWDDVNTGLLRGMGRSADALADRVRLTFDQKGARGGREQWLITTNPTPLIKTGRLYRSFKGEVSRSERGMEATVRTDVPYAAKHNDGVGVVQREFMFFTDDDLDLVERILGEELPV